MANVRINAFENFPTIYGRIAFENHAAIDSQLRLNCVYIPGSISFDNVAILYSRSGTTTVSASMGLYSMNGATLSLANSASGTRTNSGNVRVFLTMATSATQDVTPGNWFLGLIVLGNPAFLVASNDSPNNIRDNGPAGPFFRGAYSLTTTGLPVSIATSDCFNESDVSIGIFNYQPYILITA